MKHTIYNGLIKKQSISGEFLDTRLKINSKYSSNNLIEWQADKIKFDTNSDILDLGCGNGAQAKFLINRINKNKTLTCVDISKKSIASLKKEIKNTNLKTITVDMDKLESKFKKKYDILNSSYALYYSSNPKKLLDYCYKLLNKNGIFFITVPCYPHTMVQEINKISKVPKNVDESLKFYKNFLRKYFESRFKRIKIYNFKNTLRFNNQKDFLNLYKSTTYYKKENCNELIKIFEKKFKKDGYFNLNKNAKLLIGYK